MSRSELSQEQASHLLTMEKLRVDDQTWPFPNSGSGISVPLIAKDRTEEFLLDVYRGRIELRKVTNQLRGRQAIVLARLDLHGPPHRNPDGTEIPTPHIHLYREGFGDKWAEIVPTGRFRDLEHLGYTLEDFMRLCNISEPPLFVDKLL